MRVLFLDDSPSVRADYTRYFAELGVEAVVEEEAKPALIAMMRQGPFDIAFLDWNLEGHRRGPMIPGNNGMELSKEIVRRKCEVGEIYCHSGDNSKACEMARILRDGGYSVFVTPLDRLGREELSEIVEAWREKNADLRDGDGDGRG